MLFIRRENLSEFLRIYPLTSIIIIVETVIMILTFYINISKPNLTVYAIGGIVQERIREGEYWRLFSYAFLHSGFGHFFTNMMFLAIFGAPAEKLLEKAKYLLLILFLILNTGIFVYLFEEESGVGASGIGFGFLGLYLSFIIFYKAYLDKDSKLVILMFSGAALISHLVFENVSLIGHVGGLVGGFVYGMLLFLLKIKLSNYFFNGS